MKFRQFEPKFPLDSRKDDAPTRKDEYTRPAPWELKKMHQLSDRPSGYPSPEREDNPPAKASVKPHFGFRPAIARRMGHADGTLHRQPIVIINSRGMPVWNKRMPQLEEKRWSFRWAQVYFSAYQAAEKEGST
jgi:hypothetical protein